MFNPLKTVNVSPDTTQLLVKAGLGIGLFFWGRHLYKNYLKSKGEAEINTPEGQIAQQLKNIFNAFPVDDAAYRRVMQLVNTNNNEKVRDLYKLLTGRFLTDDESKYINAAIQESAAKQYKINNTPGTLISIINDQIKFNVGRGSLVRFAPGQTTPISLYLKAEDIAEGVKPAAVMPPNSIYWKVTDIKLVPIEGVKMRSDWKLIFAPILPLFAVVRTRKEYAAVQIDLSGGQGKTLAWANATDFRTQKTLSGVEGTNEAREIMTIHPAPIFNEEFKPVGVASRHVVLGTPIMTLDTGKAVFIKIKTIQGLIRWVNRDRVMIKKK